MQGWFEMSIIRISVEGDNERPFGTETGRIFFRNKKYESGYFRKRISSFSLSIFTKEYPKSAYFSGIVGLLTLVNIKRIRRYTIS